MSIAQFQQNKLTARLNTILGDNALIIENVSYESSIANGFNANLSVFSEILHDIKPKDLIGTAATIAIVKDDNSFRYINGYISGITCLGSSSATGKSFYQLSIQSWLTLFAGNKINCRIYQEKNAEDVIKALFADYGGTASFSSKLTGLEKRRYWVQYNESDLNFLNRICAKEGISYTFKHENGKHELIFFNHAEQLENLIPDSILLNPHISKSDHLISWTDKHGFTAAKTSFTSYNYLAPSTSLLTSTQNNLPITQANNSSKCENYLYREDIHNITQSKTMGQNHSHQNASGQSHYMGNGSHRNLEAAKHFKIKAPNNNQFSNIEKTFTVISHRLNIHNADNTVQTVIEANEKGEFPVPNYTKTRINSLQTAIVTGPSGEDIHTDKLGRIKVQFHWDREGKKDDNSSCWLRVMQGIAGAGFGSQFTPRIGQEVVVAFENGNPDRPFVIGSLYHQENTPPYADFQGTRNGIKTRSTKNGDANNCNELYFEDKKGCEEIYLQAEKDHNTLIKNNETRTINNNQSISIAKDQTIKTGGNHQESVSNNSSLKVGSELTIDAGDKITLKVGGSKIEITSSGIKIDSTNITIKGGGVNIN